MSTQLLISKIDEVLKAGGFTRRKGVWNRRHGTSVDVIDLQVSKSGNRVTVNVGVLDVDVYRDSEGEEVPSFVRSPSCTASARIGQLIDGRDTWWQLGSEEELSELVQRVSDSALPFLERMGSREALEAWLMEAKGKSKYPVPIINLAVLKKHLGKSREACDLLATLRERSSGWRPRIEAAAKRIGCSE